MTSAVLGAVLGNADIDGKASVLEVQCAMWLEEQGFQFKQLRDSIKEAQSAAQTCPEASEWSHRSVLMYLMEKASFR